MKERLAGRLGRAVTRPYILVGVRPFHVSTSTSIESYMIKPSMLNTPARSLNPIYWNGTCLNGSRAWSPFVYHMSTGSAAADEISPPEKPEKESEKPETHEGISSEYWGVVPKSEDGAPWQWHCFQVSTKLRIFRILCGVVVVVSLRF